VQTDQWSWDANLSKVFSTGTKVALDYGGNDTNLAYPAIPSALSAEAQAFSSFLPPTGYILGQQASISLTQPLWRNFMAAEVEASVAKAAADSEAGRAANRYQAQAVLFQARQAYAQLATLRQVGAILNESLARNQKILDWTRAKYDDNLADKVDVLQCEAALRQVALNLAQNREDDAKALIVFNSLRGITPTADAGDLEALKEPDALPAAKDGRQDLAAAEAALRASDAVVESVVQQFTPDISLFADLGVGQENVPAFQPSYLGGEHPQTVVGVKLSANLDVLLYRQVLAGARQARGSGESAVADKRRQITQDWEQLKASFASVQGRLALARELENLQREKADREKVRYQDGRTTNFQVLRFEDDYNLSRVQTLQLVAEADALAAQARFYNGDDQPW
jgi:outer membrane protein TolC